jgi:hypothetical protein
MSALNVFETVYVRVRDWMQGKGLPNGWLTYGRPQVPPGKGATRLFLCPDDDSGDAVGPAKAQRMNPVQVAVRAVGIKLTIYAASTKEGAQAYHHEDLAIRIANLAHVALLRCAERGFRASGVSGTTSTEVRVLRAGFVADASTDAWSGRVYEMRFQVDAPVNDVTYLGEAPAEADFAPGTTELEVSGPGTSSDLPTATTRVN